MGNTPYAFSRADLTDIATKTDSASEEINVVNNIVQAHTEDLGTANQSDSGNILQTHLGTWTADFYTVDNKLKDLNGKVKALIQVNINAATGARDAAK